MFQVLVELERKRHPDSLTTQGPASAAMASPKLMQAENQETSQNSDVRPFVSFGHDVACRRCPLFSA